MVPSAVENPEQAFAEAAFVRGFTGVDPFVFRTIRRSPESFATVQTMVRFEPRVYSLVPLHFSFITVLPLTEATLERFVPGVAPHVSSKVTCREKSQAAMVTFVAFLGHVSCLVRLARGLVQKRLLTDTAFEISGSLSRVCDSVLDQKVCHSKSTAAYITNMWSVVRVDDHVLLKVTGFLELGLAYLTDVWPQDHPSVDMLVVLARL